MTYSIELENELGVPDLPTARLHTAIEWVLARHGVEEGVSVVLVISDDETVHRMNADFRGVDAPTDILSFPADPLPDEIAAEEGTHLGDLIIGYPYTVQHSQGRSLDDELVLLVVHGTLHLLGFDHDNAPNQAAMWAAQQEALTALGLSLKIPLFSFEENDQADQELEAYGKDPDDV